MVIEECIQELRYKNQVSQLLIGAGKKYQKKISENENMIEKYDMIKRKRKGTNEIMEKLHFLFHEKGFLLDEQEGDLSGKVSGESVKKIYSLIRDKESYCIGNQVQ